MIDPKLIREKPEFVKENLKRRQDPQVLKLVDGFLEVDKKKREIETKINKLRHERNEASRKVAELKKKGANAAKEIKKMRQISDEIEKLQKKLEKYKTKLDEILYKIPNLLHETVPFGKDEHDNVEIRRWGSPPKFDFEPKSHLELAMQLDLLDRERAAKVAGHGFYYIKGKFVLLDLALIRFAIDELMKKGYKLVEPPFMLNERAYRGAEDFEFIRDQAYKIEGDDLFLIGTAEHPLATMFMNETLLKEQLPMKFIGVSPCFRREVGAHGKYTKGLYRMHHFNKVEMFIISKPEESWQIFEQVQKDAEELYQKLGLHYRVVNVCTGDIGYKAAKKYDIEAWMADGKFREVGSNSNCTDYQARSLNIKYREKEGQAPAGFVHMINNTAIATSRTMIAIMEQYQQRDGTIKIPKVLWKYTGFKEIGKE